jgi:hypothetical protein
MVKMLRKWEKATESKRKFTYPSSPASLKRRIRDMSEKD